MGPTIIPFETACYTCLDKRLQANNSLFQEDKIYAKYLNENSINSQWKHEYSPLSELAAHLFLFEIMRIVTYFSVPTTYGAPYSMNTLTGKPHISRVLKMPRCASCSTINIVPRRQPMSERATL